MNPNTEGQGAHLQPPLGGAGYEAEYKAHLRAGTLGVIRALAAALPPGHEIPHLKAEDFAAFMEVI